MKSTGNFSALLLDRRHSELSVAAKMVEYDDYIWAIFGAVSSA